MDSKINQVSAIIFTILFFLILIYYLSERGILKYDYVNKLLASEKLNINMLASRNHQLVDFDASAFIPYFIQKLGDPKDPIRKGFKQIVKQISQVYPPAKVFNYLISGLASKNARQRAECLEELGHLIESIGIQPFNPQVTLKEMAKQIGDRDNSVRNAALNSITIAYQIAGEVVYKYVGKVKEILL